MARTASIKSRVIDISVFRSIVSHLEDTDSWLSSVGESQSVFTSMMDDPKVESLVNNRKDRVLQMQGSFTDTKNKTVSEACAKHLGFNTFQKLNRVLLNAIPFGIALCEVNWELKDGLYVPESFTPIPRTAISFPNYASDPFTPWLSATSKPLSDPYKFMIHRNDAGDGNVWGRPAIRSSYWAWKFKRLGFKFWIMAAERIGVPSILAIFEARTDTDADARAKTLNNLMAEIGSGSTGALGNVKDIKVVESAIADFEKIVDTCNAEIAYGITGQTLTTNQAEYGTKAQGELHSKTYDSTTFGDAYLLQETDQRLVKWFCEINFPGEEVPTYDIDSTDYAPWEIVRDAIDRGVPVSLSSLYEKNHLPKPKDEADIFLKPAGSPEPMFGDRGSDRDSFFFRTRR